ncbi:MAG: hypothetical protein V7L27_01390 [Nostoc sp.]
MAKSVFLLRFLLGALPSKTFSLSDHLPLSYLTGIDMVVLLGG